MPEIDEFNRREDDGMELGRALRDLPQPRPLRSEWSRLAATLEARGRAHRPRQWPRWAAIAAALALAALVPLTRMRGPAAPQEPQTVAVTDGQIEAGTSPNRELIARNQALEALLQGGGEPLDAGALYASAQLEDLIGMVDVELSATSDEAREARLWQQRLVLLDQLAGVRSQGLSRRPDQPHRAGLMPASYVID